MGTQNFFDILEIPLWGFDGERCELCEWMELE